MRISLITKENICKINMQDDMNNQYWLTDSTGKKVIKIVEKKGKVAITSNNYAKIINPKYIEISGTDIKLKEKSENIYVDKTIINDGNIYAISLGSYDNIGIIYFTKEDSNSFEKFNIVNTKEINIGSGANNNIVCKSAFIADKHAQIYKENDTWYIKSFDDNFGVFVNDLPICDYSKKIFNGDRVFIMGIKIIMINDILFINTHSKPVKLDSKIFSPIKEEKIILPNDEEDDDIEKEIMEKSFYRGPRLKALVKEENITIDLPPKKSEREEKPLFFSIGASFAMALVSIMSFFNAFVNFISGKTSFASFISSIVMCLAMIVAMVLLPILNRKYDQKIYQKNLEKRDKRYREYLNKKQKIINDIKIKNNHLLLKNYTSVDECVEIIENNTHRLWERKKEDSDFLTIRLGIGEVPLKINIPNIEDKFSMDDDELLEEYKDLLKKSEKIDNSPVTISLLENRITSIIDKDSEHLYRYMKGLIVQLVTFHSYVDLKIVFLFNNNSFSKLEYVKMLPHVWDNSKKVRFFADNYNDMLEISKQLLEQQKNSMEKDDGNENDYDEFPYYLIITDNYRKIQDFEFIQNLVRKKVKTGYGLLCLTDDIYNSPNECNCFINFEGDKGKISYSDDERINEFSLEKNKIIFFENITHNLANISINIKENDVRTLPNNYTFLEMFDVESVEELNIYERWQRNDTTLSLSAPIGIDSFGDLIVLDAHEKYHGPHGLIAGSTGSGKSEFILTYILSLAINYHPNDVSFLLIDYKGGGLAGAFEKKDIKLPHLVGTITNIDKSELNRSLVSIQSELRKRQILFNEARNLTDGGTIDIYKYQKLYHDNVIDEPIPHLFIICDEFAELKQQQPEFMDELISVSRIGRSLGVHLILATQKPAGIVNDQIRSNSKFSICLKVQDTSDSHDVIDTKDAAFLRNPGQFYMKVGNDEYYVLGASRMGRCYIYT